MARSMKKTQSPENPKSEEIKQEERVEKKATPSSLRQNYILCRSVTVGGLHITCNTGNSYYFKDYGSECEIEYFDLVALIRKHSDHIFEPRIIIEDADVLEEFPQVAKVYEETYNREYFMEIFDLPLGQMQAEIQKLPESTKNTVRSLIATEIANGHIDSVKKIRFLSEYYESDFNLISELFGK